MKYSSICPIYGVIPFYWFKYSVLHNNFIDNQWLFHVLIKPFIQFGVLGAKIYIILIIILINWISILILKNQNIKHYFLFFFFFWFGSIDFLVRLSALRVTSLSILAIALLIYSLFSNCYILLFLTSLLYTTMYSGFLFIPVISFLYYWTNPKKTRYIGFSVIFAGMLLGILLHPNYPQIIPYTIQSIYKRIFFSDLLPMGQEWYPYNLLYFLKFNMIIIIISSIYLYIYFNRSINIKDDTHFFLLLAIFYFMLMTKSGRNIDYFYLIFIFLIFSLDRDLFENAVNKEHSITATAKFSTTLGIFLILGFSIYQLNLYTENVNRLIFPLDRFQKAANWFTNQKNQMKSKRIIYNVSWSDFPQLFYWNSEDMYICGLDPNFIDEYDKNLARLYFEIAEGKVINPGYYISEKFKASYVIVSKPLGILKSYDRFVFNADKDTYLRKMFEDNYCYIYQIINT